MIEIVIAVVFTAVITFFFTWYVFKKRTLAYYERRINDFKTAAQADIDMHFGDLAAKAEKEIRDHEAFNIAKGQLKGVQAVHAALLTHRAIQENEPIARILKETVDYLAAEVRRLK